MIAPNIPPVKERFARVGTLRRLPEFIDNYGVDSGAFFAILGLDPRVLDNPLNIIPFVQYARIFSLGAEHSGCESFGADFGLSATLDDLGTLGLEMRCAPNLGAAFLLAETALAVENRGCAVRITMDGESAMIQHMVIDPYAQSTAQLSAAALGLIVAIFREFCGPTWVPHSVELPFQRPKNAAHFKAGFGCNLTFKAPTARVHFSSSDLLAQRKPVCGNHVPTGLSVRQNDVLSDVVRTICINRIFAGHPVTVGTIAAELGLSKRTLSRRLSARSTSVRDLLLEARLTSAKRLLIDTDMSVTEVSQHVGYSEIAAFSRAFQTWTGESPTKIRRHNFASPG